METPQSFFENGKRRIRIEKPEAVKESEARLREEVRKYARLIPSEPEPNMGRLEEIREEIRNNNYLSRKKIDDAAARLTARFLKGES